MIYLRELKTTDAALMLEWMHDEDIQKAFKHDFSETSLKEAEAFCAGTKIPDNIESGMSLHFAIADSGDEYLGTISLKEIDLENGSAEYAIVTRKKAHGKKVAYKATGLILRMAFMKYGLHRVYLNVYSNNTAAIKLYEKCGFVYEGEFREHFIMENQYINWKWYSMLESEFDESKFGIEEIENG